MLFKVKALSSNLISPPSDHKPGARAITFHTSSFSAYAMEIIL